MKHLLILLFCMVSAMAQDGPNVNQSAGPPVSSFTSLLFYDGSGNAQYICTAKSVQPTSVFAKSSQIYLALTNIVVLTNVGTVTTGVNHGLQVGNLITWSGATVDTDLNGVYKIATTPSATTFTIATASVANATYTESTLKFTTTAPRSSAAIWDIQYNQYDGSNNLTISQRANGVSSMTSICDNRATIKYQ